METWCIVWSQTFPETGTVRHMNRVVAINAAQLLAQWERKRFCNARVEAVWRQDFAWECNRILGDKIAENGTRGAADARNGTRGKGRRVPEWVTRAKLAEHWTCAVAAAEKMDREVLEAAFANCYARWCDENSKRTTASGEGEA